MWQGSNSKGLKVWKHYELVSFTNVLAHKLWKWGNSWILKLFSDLFQFIFVFPLHEFVQRGRRFLPLLGSFLRVIFRHQLRQFFFLFFESMLQLTDAEWRVEWVALEQLSQNLNGLLAYDRRSGILPSLKIKLKILRSFPISLLISQNDT